MRRDRNTFFQEAQMSAMGYYPNQTQMMPNQMNMPNQMMPNQMPCQASQPSNSFYAGPDMNSNLNNDLESRLAKIERQIHRLESRVSKLETTLPNAYATDDIEINNNMYMI